MLSEYLLLKTGQCCESLMVSKSTLTYLFVALVLAAGLVNFIVPMQFGGVSFKLHELMLAVMSVVGFGFIAKKEAVSSMVLAGILVILFLVSVADSPLASVVRDMLQLLYFFSFFVFASLSRDHFQRIDKIIIALLVILAPIAFTVGVDNDYDRWQGVGFATQLLYNMRLPLLGFSVLIFFYMVGVREAVIGFGKNEKYFFLAVLILILCAAFYIRTRGLLLSYFAVFSLVLLFSFVERKRRSLVLAIVSAVLVFAFLYSYLVVFSSNERVAALTSFVKGDVSVLATDHTMYLRLMFWEEAVSQINSFADIILGVGFGSYLYLDPWGIGEWKMMPASLIHNQFLSLFYNGGMAVVFYLYIYFGLIARRASEKRSLYAYVFGVAVYSFFTPLFSDSVYAAFVFYFLARYAFYRNVSN